MHCWERFIQILVCGWRPIPADGLPERRRKIKRTARCQLCVGVAGEAWGDKSRMETDRRDNVVWWKGAPTSTESVSAAASHVDQDEILHCRQRLRVSQRSRSEKDL